MLKKQLSLTLSTGCVCSTGMFAFTAMTKVVTSVFWCHNCHSNNTQCFPVLLFVSKFLNEYALFLPFSLWQNILFHKYCDRNLPTTVLGKEISISGRKKKNLTLIVYTSEVMKAKGRKNETGVGGGDQPLMTLSCQVVTWSGSCNRKETLVEKLGKIQITCAFN